MSRLLSFNLFSPSSDIAQLELAKQKLFEEVAALKKDQVIFLVYLAAVTKIFGRGKDLKFKIILPKITMVIV